MTQKIILTRGLPASGKTTFALKHIKKYPKFKRINKDDLRSMVDDGKWTKENEKMILKARNALVRTYLKEGYSVIIDDCNLTESHFVQMAGISNEFDNVKVETKDFTDASPETCIKNDLNRSRSVGKDVIMRMYNNHLKEPVKVYARVKEIPNFPGYFASNNGDIYSYWVRGKDTYIGDTPKKLSPAFCGSGYLKLSLRGHDESQHNMMVHRLICMAFYGLPQNKDTASHLNGNKVDNRVVNLTWESMKDNHARKKQHGTDDCGSKNSRALLNREQIVLMKDLIKDGKMTHEKIGEKFGVSRAFVTKVANGHRYKDDLPYAIILDQDGTLSHMVDRSPYDFDRVEEDVVDTTVVKLVDAIKLSNPGIKVVIMSGRDGICEPQTRQWLNDNDIEFDALYMRAEGDTRKDTIVKKELYEEHIKGKYNVFLVIDDRLQVCQMWHSLGLKLFRVGDPDANF